MVKYLPFVLLALAFVILLMTLYPYYQIKQRVNSTYQCPQSEWVDCMPRPGIPNPQCQKSYLDWAQNNCSNFKGAAL
jgi:hypothetical protein